MLKQEPTSENGTHGDNDGDNDELSLLKAKLQQVQDQLAAQNKIIAFLKQEEGDSSGGKKDGSDSDDNGFGLPHRVERYTTLPTYPPTYPTLPTLPYLPYLPTYRPIYV